jgi:hypothetical protein
MSHLRNFAQIVFAAVRPRFARLIVISAAVTSLFWSDPLREGTPPPADSLRAEPSTPKPSERLEIALKRGDTLSGLLTRHGVTPPSARELIAKVRPLLNLKKLRPGNQVELTVDPDHRTVQEMEIPLGDNIVRAKTTPQGWSVEREAIPSTAVTRVIRDTISSSLYVNGVAAGLSPEQILALARIFEYDIDFYSDFQRGDEAGIVGGAAGDDLDTIDIAEIYRAFTWSRRQDDLEIEGVDIS